MAAVIKRLLQTKMMQHDIAARFGINPGRVSEIKNGKRHADVQPRFGDLTMAKKQSSSSLSTLASKVMSGAKKPTAAETRRLAASVLSQDEKKGK